ncbi:MAG: hypothetical protein ACLQLC_08160 [Candidatus Sulfotelmatobacter sp.]
MLPKIVRRKHLRDAEWNEYDGVTILKPNDEPLFVWLPEVIDQSVWLPAYKLLREVSGGLDNRPDIIGEKMRMPRIRKGDGEVGAYQATPLSVMETVRGRSDMLGYFKYKNSAPGVPDCDLAGWTMREPDVYAGVREFIEKVDDVYRGCDLIKAEYAAQKKYMDTVPEQWKIKNTKGGITNFTTMYVLKDHATAIHKDKFDEKETFGVMASLGNPDAPWKGGEIVWPKFRIGCDYRPGDVLLGDVHEYHGNLFLNETSERLSCIFFVRKGMHQCPAKP